MAGFFELVDESARSAIPVSCEMPAGTGISRLLTILIGSVRGEHDKETFRRNPQKLIELTQISVTRRFGEETKSILCERR